MDNNNLSKKDKKVEGADLEKNVPEVDSEITDKTVLIETINEEALNSKKKSKKKMKLAIIAAVAIVLVIAGGIGYLTIKKNPTFVFKDAINDKYKDFSKSLDDLNDSLKDMEKRMDADKHIVDMKVSFKDGIFEDLEDTTINAKFGVDKKKQAMEVSASVKNDGETLIDGAGFIKDDALYVYSDSLLDGSYLVQDDLDDMISDEIGFSLKDSSMDDLIDKLEEELEESDDDEARILLDVLKNMKGKKLTEIIDTKLIDKIAKDGKNALIDSLDKDNMEKDSETIDINDLSVKTNKYTYKLNEKAVKKLMSNFSKNVKDDKDMISNISKLTGVSKSDIKDLVDEIGNEDNWEGFGKGFDFSIYTTTVLTKPVRYEISAEGVTISYSEYKDNYYILFKADMGNDQVAKIEIIGTPNGKKTEVKGKYKIGDQEGTFLKGTVTNLNSKKVEYDLTIVIEALDMEINISEKADKNGGTAKIDFNGYFNITSETKIEKDKVSMTEKINLDIDEDEVSDLIDLIKELTNEDISIKDIKKQLNLDSLELKGSIIFDVTYSNSGDVADYDVDDAKSIKDIDGEKVQKRLEDIIKDIDGLKDIFENFDLDDLEDILFVNPTDNVSIKPPRVPYDDDDYDYLDDDDDDDIDFYDNDNEDNIYEDKKCWNAYMEDYNYVGIYSDYYEEYCR